MAQNQKTMFETEEELEDTLYGKFLTFNIDNEIFGIEIRYVIEVLVVQHITPIPDVVNYIKGIINVRGQIIPVIDVRLKFSKKEVAYNDRTCIIIVNMNDISVGLIVDSVDEVILISDEDIVPPPDYKISGNNKYIKGIANSDGKIKLLLDCGKLLSDEEFEELASI